MSDDPRKKDGLASNHPLAADGLTVEDAFLVLAIRLIGSEVRRNSSARQHIIALARATPPLMTEDYGATKARLRQLAEWAGTAVMDELFARALEMLRDGYRRETLAWAAGNAVAQQETDETNALLYHIGKALGFTPSEVEASRARAFDKSAGAKISNQP
jgi:hypothetical protein